MVTFVSVLSLILLIPFVLLLYLGIFFGQNYLRNRNAPTRSVPAQILRKWRREYDFDILAAPLSVFGSLLNFFSSATITVFQQRIYWMAFLIGDKELELCLPEKVYIEREEGDLGVLTYKGDKFLDFRLLPVEAWAALASGQSPAPAFEQTSPPPPPPDKSQWDKMPRIS